MERREGTGVGKGGGWEGQEGKGCRGGVRGSGPGAVLLRPRNTLQLSGGIERCPRVFPKLRP